MRLAASLALALLLPVAPAAAGLPEATLDALAAMPRPAATIPLSLPFTDETGAGRTLAEAIGGVPALLVFADFTCRTLCGPMVEFAAAGLQRTGLRPGPDYRLLIIGIDPKDGPTEARALKLRHVEPGSPLSAATTVLSGDAGVIRAATAAADYRYAYDDEHDQFAHPAAAFVVTSAGRIARVLSPLALDGPDLRLALVDAGNGRVGSFTDRVRLLCYGFDPARGLYTPLVTRWLAIGCAGTAALLAGGILLLLTRGRREAAS